MSIKDRTGEYKATVESLRGQYSGYDGYNNIDEVDDPVVRRRSPLSTTPNANDPQHHLSMHSQFMARASTISKDLQVVCGQLERLTKVTRSSKALLDDHRHSEYVELAASIENSIQRLNGDLNGLRAIQRQQPEQQHSSGVLVSLQTRLADASKSLAGVLRERERVEQEQRARREQYSAGIKLPDNLGLTDRRPLLVENDTDSGSSPYQEKQKQHNMPLSFQQMSLVQSTDTSYLDARSAAVQGIERSIHEIGSIFQQLTQMIAEQGDLVQRIDANIDDVHFNIGRGHAELLKYYNYVSSNRWLLLKMFVVLMVFMVIFNAVFL